MSEYFDGSEDEVNDMTVFGDRFQGVAMGDGDDEDSYPSRREKLEVRVTRSSQYYSAPLE